MTDPFTLYEIGMQRLLDHLGPAHPRYAEALIYQQRLLENIALTRLHGDTAQRRAERADVIAQINALAQATGGPVMTADPGPAGAISAAPAAIQQTITADDGATISHVNQVVGDQRNITLRSGDYAEGSIDKRQGTFHETHYPDATLSPRDRDNRRRMLEQVRRFWIAGVLEQSLSQEVLLDLHLQTDPQAISFVGPRLLAQTDREPQPLPPGTTIAQVYREAHQRLLILGAPGAGKTTLLLDLARTLLDQAERDERCPLPVVFNLSSWAQQRLPLERWLVQELRDQYGVGRRLAQQWVRANAILPLLDGLDEVAAPQRAGCVQAINTFCREHGTEGIVVCSRVADYAAIGERLALDAAVLLQPLDDAQIDHYLAWVGQPLAGVQAVLAQDADLRDLVRTPLLLNIVSLAYQHQRPEDLVGLPPEAQRRHLFDSYVQHMFARRARHDPQPYPSQV
jgi:energy-coupling factor transporter ATP-binding protein EcfA2